MKPLFFVLILSLLFCSNLSPIYCAEKQPLEYAPATPKKWKKTKRCAIAVTSIGLFLSISGYPLGRYRSPTFYNWKMGILPEIVVRHFIDEPMAEVINGYVYHLFETAKEVSEGKTKFNLIRLSPYFWNAWSERNHSREVMKKLDDQEIVQKFKDEIEKAPVHTLKLTINFQGREEQIEFLTIPASTLGILDDEWKNRKGEILLETAEKLLKYHGIDTSAFEVTTDDYSAALNRHPAPSYILHLKDLREAHDMDLTAN